MKIIYSKSALKRIVSGIILLTLVLSFVNIPLGVFDQTASAAGSTLTINSDYIYTVPVDQGYGTICQLEATGGVGPYIWKATKLPPGLFLNKNTGRIYGKPLVPGEYPITVVVKDMAGNTAYKEMQIWIHLPVWVGEIIRAIWPDVG